MEYKIYRFAFQNAVHFGSQSLEGSEYTFCADTLFSAMCQEAVKIGEDCLSKLYQCVKSGKLLFSDAFPYIAGRYYLPKPMKRMDNADGTADSVRKKAFKKLKYIAAEDMDIYLQGKYDVLNEPDVEEMLGKYEMKTRAAIRGEEQTRPYRVGNYYFTEGNGLYIIAGYMDDEAGQLLDELLENLSFAGIGGKRSSGMGRYTLYSSKLPEALRRRLDKKAERYMTLSVSMPKEEELEEVLKEAEYVICRRGGFVSSQGYAPEHMRKRDLYVFKAGACVAVKYQGDVYDVSSQAGAHPVYRYAKPLFMEVDV